jgi:small subunit ribosomal protein S20
MANIKSAEKRILQNERHRERNRNFRSRMRTAIKRLRTALESGDSAQAQELLPQTLRVIDETVQKGVVHRNTAARYKSRLTRAVNALAS